MLFRSKKYTSRKDVTSDEIDEVFDDIEELIKDGKLFSDDIFEVVAKQFKARQSVIKAVCLHVAHSCNLRCRYCFADEGAYKGSGKAIMSYETAVKAIEFLIANSGTRKNLEVAESWHILRNEWKKKPQGKAPVAESGLLRPWTVEGNGGLGTKIHPRRDTATGTCRQTAIVRNECTAALTTHLKGEHRFFFSGRGGSPHRR